MADVDFRLNLKRVQSDLDKGRQLNPKSGWTALFDPHADQTLRDSIVKSLRSNVMDYAAEFNPRNEDPNYSIRGLSKLSEETLTAIVMSGGYMLSNYFYPRLNAAGVSNNFAFIGYSSGAPGHTSTKIFSDGTEMVGTVFVTEGDLKAIMDSKRIIFIDDYIETRVTLAVIGDALRRIGYSGTMNEMDRTHVVRDWMDKPLVQEPIGIPYKDMPMATEKGLVLKYAERK